MVAEQQGQSQACASMPISIRINYLLPLQRCFVPLVLGITLSVLALSPENAGFVEMGEVRARNDCPPKLPAAKTGILTDAWVDKGV